MINIVKTKCSGISIEPLYYISVISIKLWLFVQHTLKGKRIVWIREAEIIENINSYRHTTGEFIRTL